MAHFKNVDNSIWDQGVGFVGFVKDERGIAQFGFRYLNLKTPFCGQVGLLGSGAADAESMLSKLQGIPEPSTREINDLERSILLGLILSGVLVGAEFSTHNTLSLYYGAGYEIASLVRGRFQKLRDVTYLFWCGEIDEKGMGLNPYQVARYSYVDNLLLIRTATFNEKEFNTGRLNVGQNTYVVPPVYRLVTELQNKTITKPEFDSPWLCNYFVVKHAENRIAVCANIYYSAQGDPPIRFLEDEKCLTVAFKKEWLESTVRQAFKMYEPTKC